MFDWFCSIFLFISIFPKTSEKDMLCDNTGHCTLNELGHEMHIQSTLVSLETYTWLLQAIHLRSFYPENETNMEIVISTFLQTVHLSLSIDSRTHLFRSKTPPFTSYFLSANIKTHIYPEWLTQPGSLHVTIYQYFNKISRVTEFIRYLLFGDIFHHVLSRQCTFVFF